MMYCSEREFKTLELWCYLVLDAQHSWLENLTEDGCCSVPQQMFQKLNLILLELAIRIRSDRLIASAFEVAGSIDSLFQNRSPGEVSNQEVAICSVDRFIEVFESEKYCSFPTCYEPMAVEALNIYDYPPITPNNFQLFYKAVFGNSTIRERLRNLPLPA